MTTHIASLPDIGIKPYYADSLRQIYCGDCREVLSKMRGFSAVVTDPPYNLSFMGKDWDSTGVALQKMTWEVIRRACLPGAPLLSFGGTRTFHRIACAIEDAGWELRDTLTYWHDNSEEVRAFVDSLSGNQRQALDKAIPSDGLLAWVYGSGFPKSLSVSKSLDSLEKNIWLNISKLFDNHYGECGIVRVWKQALDYARSAVASYPSTAEKGSGVTGDVSSAQDSVLISGSREKNQNHVLRGLENVRFVGPQFAKNITGTGMSMQRSDTVHGPVVLKLNSDLLLSSAITAELILLGVQHSSEGNITTVRESVDMNTSQLPSLVIFVGRLLQSLEAKRYIITSTVRCVVRELLNERMEQTTKEDEVLKTWLGKKKSLNLQDINVLCVGLIEGLKLIILNQSKTFQNLGTKLQMDCVSATTVTITDSTMESLISFTVGILKSKAIDKAAGAEREIVGHEDRRSQYDGGKRASRAINTNWRGAEGRTDVRDNAIRVLTAPATSESKLWSGWGTALKPAYEPITLAMSPVDKTFASNALEYGVAGLNIDECRVEFVSGEVSASAVRRESTFGGRLGEKATESDKQGRINRRGDPERWRQPRPSEQLGRFPANLIHDGSEEVISLFPQSKGQQGDVRGTESSHTGDENTVCYGEYDRVAFGRRGDGNGSAARFFYCAKAPQSERDAGCESLVGGRGDDGEYRPNDDGSHDIQSSLHGATVKGSNNHPTVKPLALMEYLCKLVKMPEYNLVLDPFVGSGTTLLACGNLGILSVGIDSDEHSCDIAAHRCSADMVARIKRGEF